VADGGSFGEEKWKLVAVLEEAGNFWKMQERFKKQMSF
jgi:hypothetical protein